MSLKRKSAKVGMVLAACGFIGLTGLANNIDVSDVARGDQKAGSHWMVRFNVQWTNSWRRDLPGEGHLVPYNYDAAWVFVKYRTNSAGVWGDWKHASLSTNASDHAAPAGSRIDVGLTGTNGAGVFLYRSANGSGLFTANGVRLRWNYAADGVADNAALELKVCAIEMVYVTEGAFWLGSGPGAAEVNRFHAGGQSDTTPFRITNENELAIGNSAGQLYYTADTADGGDRTGVLSNAFPKGYAAFYGMKYEITQGQYADFLNTLTSNQATTRYPNYSANRYAITKVAGVYISTNAYVACNFLSWADGAAYADWAGLGPMTELEYEKACRGINTPVANEYAWGSINITQATSIVNGGLANETPGNAGANCVYNNAGAVQGPMRAGCMGIGTGTRQATGAGYYGMMELSGNLWERPVTVGKPEGRSFTGFTGDGQLDGTGNADVSGWPSVSTAIGIGWRGGHLREPASYARVSDRCYAACVGADGDYLRGWRGSRPAP